MSNPPGPTGNRTDGSSADQLRRRAEQLVELADALERQRVMRLPDLAVSGAWDGIHAGLCERMLRRNVHQLHRAADDLRSTAHRFRREAAELDVDAAVA